MPQSMLEVRRRCEAPVERVFDAWLEAQSVRRFLFATPAGIMQQVEIDPQPGGRFTIAEQRGNVLAEHFGCYLEIDRPRRLVFDFATDKASSPTRVTIVLKADGAATLVQLSHPIAPQWAAIADRARQGWTMILDGLARVVEA